MGGFSSVETYFAMLPGGMEAYPECKHKGEPLGVWLKRSPTAGLASRLPSRVAALLEPNGVPTWVPEVHATAVYLAIREAHFPNDASFLAHARECNMAILDTPTNRVVFWVAAPAGILRATGPRWGSLHRGSRIDVRARRPGAADLELTFPENLLPEIVLRGNATAFACALENSGAKNVTMDLTEFGPTKACFVASWK